VEKTQNDVMVVVASGQSSVEEVSVRKSSTPRESTSSTRGRDGKSERIELSGET
jgi:hypothetical protein